MSGDPPDQPQRAAFAMARLSERTLGVFQALVLFFLMGLTAVDVVGRYFFNAPVRGGDELTQIGMALLIFTGLPMITAAEGHVTIGLFESHIRGRFRKARDVGANLLAASVVALLAWNLARLAQRFGRLGDETLFLKTPLAPIAWVLCGLAVLTAMVLLHLAWRYFRMPLAEVPEGAKEVAWD
jgi:TRAP-type C4-dicarboxylate transport system permease small subunit